MAHQAKQLLDQLKEGCEFEDNDMKMMLPLSTPMTTRKETRVSTFVRYR